VALVSATCPACVFGAKAVKASVLDAYPDADIQVSVVWIDMLRSDNQAAALQSSALFGDPPDPRLKQFHDPNQRTGRAFAHDLLYPGGGVAWDIYLYYDKDAVWNDTLPEPVEWYHQLSGGRRADPTLFRPGTKLTTTLREATGRALNLETSARVTGDPELTRATVRFNGAVLEIGGMDCQLCVNRVSAALEGVPGVQKVDVSLETGLAWITTENGTSVDRSTLIGAVEAGGFKAAVPDKANVLYVPVAMVDVGPRIELLSFPGCPTAQVLHANLTEATAQLGLVTCRVESVNLGELEAGDPRRGWGSPTILVDGVDLFGKTRPADDGMSCRIYPDGKAPTAEQLVARLKAQLSTGN
jgi:copper chaperone CopZ